MEKNHENPDCYYCHIEEFNLPSTLFYLLKLCHLDHQVYYVCDPTIKNGLKIIFSRRCT